MSDNQTNKKKIIVDLPETIYQKLEENLQKLKGKQLPDSTTLDQLVELILSNYINSYKAMEKMGDQLLGDLQSKLGNIFGGDTGGDPEDFYKNMLNSFKNVFDTEKKPEEKPVEKPKKPEPTDKKKS